MRFEFGPPSDDPSFDPEQEAGWQKLREMGPGTIMLIGSLVGIPLAALIGNAWSRIPGGLTSTGFDVMTLGRWSAVLLPLLLLLSMAIFFAGLILVHELIHALACPHFGLTSETVLGVWPRKCIAYANHSGPISLKRGIVIGSAPFMILSVAPLLVAAVGGPQWTLLQWVSVVNAMMCGGDAVIGVMIVSQVPFNATLRNKGWNTWWRSGEPGAAPAEGDKQF